MLAQDKRDRLLGAMVELYAEIGDGGPDAAWESEARVEPNPVLAGMLGAEDEELVAEVSAGLSRIAAAAAGLESDGWAPAASAIAGAIGGAELVMRSEIMAGRVERVPGLLPGFVYLVTLPFVAEEEAMRLSRRAVELVDGGGGDRAP
jgi:hypothetical protein